MVQGKGHGINRKVAAGQVIFDTAGKANQVHHQRAGAGLRRGFHHHLEDAAGQVMGNADAAQPLGQLLPHSLHLKVEDRDSDIQVVGRSCIPGGRRRTGQPGKQRIPQEAPPPEKPASSR